MCGELAMVSQLFLGVTAVLPNLGRRALVARARAHRLSSCGLPSTLVASVARIAFFQARIPTDPSAALSCLSTAHSQSLCSLTRDAAPPRDSTARCPYSSRSASLCAPASLRSQHPSPVYSAARSAPARAIPNSGTRQHCTPRIISSPPSSTLR